MRKYILLGVALWVALLCHAQSAKRHSALDDFRKEIRSDFNEFRRTIMHDYIDFVRENWREFHGEKGVSVPIEKDVPPVVRPDSTAVVRDGNVVGRDSNAVVPDGSTTIREVIKPVTVVPQPTPYIHFRENSQGGKDSICFMVFGTMMKVRYDEAKKIKIEAVNEESIANAIGSLSSECNDNTIVDCLRLRNDHALSDWAYLMMLKSLSENIYGKDSNEAVLLMAYLFMQSGYKMRMAYWEDRLYMLFGSEYDVYEKNYFRIGGEKFYGIDQFPSTLHICQAVFPKERALSLCINGAQRFAEEVSDVREIKTIGDPQISIRVSVNKNLMDFYNTFPTSKLGDNICSRWAIYANSPMAEDVREQLYPQLRRYIDGMSQIEAANILLKWVQKGFVYAYDNEVWGHDRAFFAEETLFYKSCDCEDRSILLTRLLRDLLGVRCLLVYYPDHLAAAVEITKGECKGDYITYEGHRYYVADGTILYGANIGVTMRGKDNSSAVVIELR